MMFGDGSAAHRMAQRVHAIQRCAERYGILLTISEYLTISDRIWAYVHGNGCAGVEQIGGKNVDRYFVRFNDVLLLVGWSKETYQVSTFLPLASPLDCDGP
jgi:hypothetical protein